MSVSVCQFSQGEEKIWDDYVYQHPASDHCHLSAWRQVISESYGHRPYYLWHKTNGRVQGVLPLISMRNIVLRRTFVSLPFLDDGGICADSEKVELALFQEALQLAEEQRVDSIDFRHRRQSVLGLPLHGKKVTLVLSLSDDPALIWKGLPAKVRNQVRKAEKSRLTVSWHALEGLNDFYEVFAMNMRLLGSPVHGLRFFSEIFKVFEGRVKMLLVRKGEMTIGGAVCLLFKDSIQVPWASSRRDYRSHCPNNLLYWEAIRWACKNNYLRFDFGRSSRGSGTYRFKKQWGAVEEPLNWEYWTGKKQGEPIINADDSRYHAVTKTWSMLPLSITKLIGPIIRGRLSN